VYATSLHWFQNKKGTLATYFSLAGAKKTRGKKEIFGLAEMAFRFALSLTLSELNICSHLHGLIGAVW
jgi:hypothetical protein